MRRKTHEEFCKEIEGRNISVLTKYKNNKHKLLFKCDVCLHEWKTEPNTIAIKGCGCPSCAGYHVTHEDIVERLKDRDLIVLSRYKNALTKMEFCCANCFMVWKAKVGHVMDGTGCPECSKNIFSLQKDATFYIYIIDKVYIGFGISNDFNTRNIDHVRRFKRHKISHKLYDTYNMDGKKAYQIEKVIKKTFDIVNLGIKGFKTEGLFIEDLPKLLNLLEINNVKTK